MCEGERHIRKSFRIGDFEVRLRVGFDSGCNSGTSLTRFKARGDLVAGAGLTKIDRWRANT